MIQTLIVEDEQPAAKRLSKLITQTEPAAKILDIIDSVEEAVKWLRLYPHPDLIFMDIQLADGISFEIFNMIRVETPVIFTTAFDQYALKAFKVNSIDYLLKPIVLDELEKAFHKFKNIQPPKHPISPDVVAEIIRQMTRKPFREKFLVKKGNALVPLRVEEAAIFVAEDKMVWLIDVEGKKHLLDQSLDKLEEELNPEFFFRISRQIMVHNKMIGKIHSWFSGRLKLDLLIPVDKEIIVSRDRVNDFKKWMTGSIV